MRIFPMKDRKKKIQEKKICTLSGEAKDWLSFYMKKIKKWPEDIQQHFFKKIEQIKANC